MMAALVAALGLGIPNQALAAFFTIDFSGDGILQLDGSDDRPWSFCGTTGINPQPGCDTPVGVAGVADGIVGAVDIFNLDTSGATTFGTVNFLTQDFLFFDVTLESPSAPVDQIGASVGTVSGNVDPLGTGYLSLSASNGSEVPTAMSIASSFGFPPGGSGLFDYDHNGLSAGNLEAGETTRILFISYAAGELTDGLTASFMISSGTDENFTTPIVPEPSTVLLLSAGLVALGAARRRQLRRSR